VIIILCNRSNIDCSITIRGIKKCCESDCCVSVGSMVGIDGLYKMMISSSSSSLEDNDDKVVVVVVGVVVDANADRMSRRLKTRSDFDHYITQFKSPAT